MDVASWKSGRPVRFAPNDIYVCEYKYNDRTRSFTPYTSKKWGPVDQMHEFHTYIQPMERVRTILVRHLARGSPGLGVVRSCLSVSLCRVT